MSDSDFVFNISTKASYPSAPSMFDHGYGANLRKIPVGVYLAHQQGKLSSEDLVAFYMAATIQGNPNADPSVLLKKGGIGEVSHQEIKQAPAIEQPNETNSNNARIAAEEERKSREAESRQAEGQEAGRTEVEGDRLPIDLAYERLAKANNDLSRLGVGDLALIAGAMNADVSQCKGKAQFVAALKAKIASVPVSDGGDPFH